MPMKPNFLFPQSIASLLMLAMLCSITPATHAQSSGNRIVLKNDLGGYSGTQDFYTFQMDGGVFNSKTDLDDQTLRIAPLDADAKSVIRFDNIPLSRTSYGSVNRLALVLTFKQPAQSDTLMLHNLNASDIWDERRANYNSLNGTAPWSGADGKLIDAWMNTDGLAVITGNEDVHSTLTIEIHPQDAAARKAVLDSWLDGSNQGMVIRGISGTNEFYSSDAYNMAHRPELIIELSSY